MNSPPHIDGLRVGNLIGAGSWADVYEAARIEGGETVAVKILRPRPGDDETSVSRMLQEAQLCWLLDHPNVVRVFDWGFHPSHRIYLVMERLHGETVEQRLNASGPLTPAAVMALARGVVLGLKAIHQRAVHRDIKPSNLFLCCDFADHRAVKVLDLGIACLPSDDPQRIVHTEQGEVVGTPAYAAPERFRGTAADERTDLYSLGAVLYECLVGRPAFDGTAMQIAVQVCRATRAPEVVRPDAPEALIALIAQMMHPLPDRRPGSADDVLRALDEIEERADINRWAVIQRTTGVLPTVRSDAAESFLAAVMHTVLENFHPDHVPTEIRESLESISTLTVATELAQRARDAAQETATRLGRELQGQSEALEARQRSADAALNAQRTLIERQANALRQIHAELDGIDTLFATRCQEFDQLTREAMEVASSLAEPVETGGRMGRIVEERLAELDGLAARHAHLAKSETKTRTELERARAALGERLGELGQLARAHAAVEAERHSTLYTRESEARDLAERAERLHLDRTHARLALGLAMQRELFT